MTAPKRLREYLHAKDPARCPACGWHEPTQGHAPECERAVALGRQGMEDVAGANPTDVDAVDRVLTAFIAKGLDFTIDDLHPHLRHVQQRNVIGSRVQTFARRGRIRDTGARIKSRTPSTHGREVRVWRPVA
jgi:hypothetical protein